MLSRMFFVAALAAALSACSLPASQPGPTVAADLPPVQSTSGVDLQRYAGKWFELARLPESSPRRCVSDTTTHYLPNGEGRFEVISRCRTRSGVDESGGSASVLPDSGNAKWKVSMLWPLRGDYWIIGLDPNYRWAVAGTPDRRNLWILARAPQLPREELDKALATAREQGYDVDALLYTPHDKGV